MDAKPAPSPEVRPIETLRAIGVLDALREMAAVSIGATLGREQVRELVAYVDRLTGGRGELTEEERTLVEMLRAHWTKHPPKDGLADTWDLTNSIPKLRGIQLLAIIDRLTGDR